jgi:vesicle coat complex subunit
MHQYGKPAVRALADVLQDDDAQVRCGAAVALAKIGPGTPEVVPQLVKALDDHTKLYHGGTDSEDSGWIRGAAATALGRLGPKAKAAVPDLERLLEDKVPTVRQAAAEALKKIKAAQEKAK